MRIEQTFYDRDACTVARSLIGKIIQHKYQDIWLKARIIEAEAYYINEKGSHSSLGKTAKRLAMFMPAGTIYMYYARGHDSFNISVQGEGNAILLKSCLPVADKVLKGKDIRIMQQLNPKLNGQPRSVNKLCAGQTLLCRALNLKVTDWDQQAFNDTNLFIKDDGYIPEKIIQTTRLGIPSGRDEDKPYRFIDYQYSNVCTSNPLSKRKPPVYKIIEIK